MNRTKSKQWLLAFLSCLLLLTCMPVGWLPGVQAEGAVQLGVIAGIGGDYKETSFVPVQVTASNSGADIEGNLVVTVGDWGSNHLNVAYYQPISIAKGATKQVTISVPGNQVGPNTYVSLMQGDKVVAKASVGGRRYSGDTLFVGVLASHPDTANFLGAMPKTAFNNPVRVLPLKAEQMPVNRTQLQMVDVLLLNNFALDSLSGQQIDAIRQWTMAGGLLMIAGGAHYGKTAGELKDLSPVEATGVTTVAALPALTVDKNNTPGLDRPFTVSTGVLREGTAIYSEAGIPLVAVRTVGEGKVMYVAYDLAEEPVASWSGNSRFWADVLNKGFGTTIHRIHRSPMDGIWPLDHAADRIPALKMPDIKWLALFFAVYALIAGPVMFYLLRRKRKQSWMWGAVPALAVVTGIAIFTVGASQRGTKPLLHQVGFIQMLGNGSAQAKAVAAMFVPRSSDYEIEVEGSGRSWPILPYRPDQTQPKAWVWSQADRTQIQFKQVEFWSMRKVGTEQFLSDVGTFESDLRYVEGGLRGTVTNKSKYTLRDVTVATDTQNQRFPEIAPGETITVELKFDPATQNRPYRGSRVHQFIPAQYQGNAGPYNNSREGQIVDILEESHNLAGARKAPVTLVGWMDAPAVEIGIKDRSYKPYNISLVAAPLSIKPSPDGYTFVPSGEIEAVRIGSSPGVDDVGDGYMMQGGEITFDFPIQPKQKNLAIFKIHLYTWSNDNTPFDKQVYNWKTGEYDSYDKAFASNIMAQEKTSVYLSAEGTLRIKFSHSFNEHRHLGLPVISVEGKVIQP
ncbi:hypothetical protein KDJ56_19020 [Brevibacillus composti]|uniref:DUF7408 domain-containing protein n=1 Tax=Brevibacillus composti TaxID=2796470 RepID=A0A7T5EJZ5_9BACL|nr:hypothetical protein [Brevibacillus composti]QQE73940.1 hypothetical protein JD108_19085 [Brevibacillus composti]QUO41024.1 hypothetical protein KDJ56_19020 [Brevibacillus composti]